MASDEETPASDIYLIVWAGLMAFFFASACCLRLVSLFRNKALRPPPPQQQSQQSSRAPSASQPRTRTTTPSLSRGWQGRIDWLATPQPRSQPPIITTPSVSNGVQSMFDFLAPSRPQPQPPPPPPSTPPPPLQPQAAFHYDVESGMPNIQDEEEEERKRQEEEERQRQRLELIRSRLQFRKILPRATSTRSSKKFTKNAKQKQQGENGHPPSTSNGNGVGSNQIHRAAVRKLLEMGYSPSLVTKALTAVGGSNVDAAANWILEHHQDDNNPPKPRTKTKPTTRTRIEPMGKPSNVTSGDACSICLEPYGVGDTIACLQVTKTGQSGKRCEHWFHDECILGWLESKDHCPLCRVNMIHDGDNDVDGR